MGKYGSRVVLSFFILVVAIFSVGTLVRSRQPVGQSLQQMNRENIAKTLTEIEGVYRENIIIKNQLVDTYGVVQSALNRRMVGNFEYWKDNNQVLQPIQMVDTSIDPAVFLDGMARLKVEADLNETPLVYIQIPPRAADGYTDAPVRAIDELEQLDNLVDTLRRMPIDVLDYRSFVEDEKFNSSQAFFKTDLHMKTEAEWEILCQLIAHLESQYGIVFPAAETVLNPEEYMVDSRPFLGNCARTTGKYFTGLDSFTMYFPAFETNMARTDASGTEVAKGTFQNAVLNGYEAQTDTNERTYWVTNYGQFTQPRYDYINYDAQGGPKVLFVSDSMAYRTAAYLSLLCERVTNIDPRYDANGYYLREALREGQYDAIVVVQKYFNKAVIFPDLTTVPNAEIISHTTPVEITRKDVYSPKITVRNTGSIAWSEAQFIRLCIFQDGSDHGYRLQLPPNITVHPGEEYTFTLEGFVAPPGEETYLEFQMVQEGIRWFGEKERVDINVE